jgi:hypothetical protein
MKKLKAIKEIKVHQLFKNYSKLTTLEASGVYLLNNNLYVVLDGRKKILKIDYNLSPNSKKNKIYAAKHKGHEDITFNPNNNFFYTIVEAIKNNGVYKGKIIKYTENFVYVDEKWINFEFCCSSKGFEGLAYINRKNKNYLLALCEGNYCSSGKQGKKKGGGRIQVLKETKKYWKPIKQIKIPSSVKFEDYAAIALRNNKVVILSQKESKLWIGRLSPTKFKLLNEGKCYNFQNNKQGKTYKYLEGVDWINNKKFVCVSDANKENKKNKYDQSIHLFELIE